MSYNREAAVAYAEKWWDTPNPEYMLFELNCTNYISQCLRAGGAPMRGHPHLARGWWYVNHKWSFSWAVAHSLYWYLRTSTTGLRAQMLSSAGLLEPGDVICYDFNGDGSWQHNTIVVAKDSNNMPLINANTYNVRMRQWDYRDSPAWTQDVEYAFFHIVL